MHKTVWKMIRGIKITIQQKIPTSRPVNVAELFRTELDACAEPPYFSATAAQHRSLQVCFDVKVYSLRIRSIILVFCVF